MSGISINHWDKCLKNRSKKVLPLARKSLSTNRDALKNAFPLDRKIKLAVAGIYQNRRKKSGFNQAKNQLPLTGIRLFFKNWISRFPQTEQKSLNEIILFQLDRKSVSTAGIENSFKKKFLSDGKTGSIYRNTQILSIRVLNRLLYKLNNGFHQQERKL